MTTLFASAPGKIILLGEHAVNRRQPALVTAFDRRVHTPHIGDQSNEGLVRMGHMTVETGLQAPRDEEPLFTV
jgi:mevalonate kinase